MAHPCTVSVVGGYLGTVITQTITFAADELADFECRLGNGEWPPCPSPHPLAHREPDHAYDVHDRETDPAGNDIGLLQDS